MSDFTMNTPIAAPSAWDVTIPPVPRLPTRSCAFVEAPSRENTVDGMKTPTRAFPPFPTLDHACFDRTYLRPKRQRVADVPDVLNFIPIQLTDAPNPLSNSNPSVTRNHKLLLSSRSLLLPIHASQSKLDLACKRLSSDSRRSNRSCSNKFTLQQRRSRYNTGLLRKQRTVLSPVLPSRITLPELN